MRITNLILTEAEQQNTMVDTIVGETLSMSVVGHFWHWQTKSYAAHKAFGEFYEKITDLADDLAEQFMGVGGELKAGCTAEMTTPFDIEAVKQKLTEFKTKVVAVESSLMKDENGQYHGIADTMIDIIKTVDKLLYLLTLK